MEIFVSQKEENYGAYQSQDIDCHKLNFCNNEPMEIVSLEQHEAEIRKPLEDEIKRLNNVVNNKAQLRCTKCGQVYYGDYDPLTFVCKCELLKQAKQEVIDELLGFIKENEYCVGDYSIENHYAIATDILKQKLNGLKEVE